MLGIVLLFAGTIFKVSIEAHRTAFANAEILRKLRAITDQINADFKGLRRDLPGKASYNLFTNGLISIRSDCIAFMANGDFQSTGQPTGKTIVGNVASIFYGHATTPNPATALPKDKILIRRQKILTSDSTVPALNPLLLKEEYCTLSLSEWRAGPAYPNPNFWVSRTPMDANNPSDIVMYMAKGVDDFKIQSAQWNSGQMRYDWWPENGHVQLGMPLAGISTSALKFSFTLYDSKGVIRDGRRFTHIVYLGD
jgi:hypothetical protein